MADRIKLTFEVPQTPPQQPDRLTSPEAQAQAALQLRSVRAPALSQAREEEQEDAELEKEQAIQSAETPAALASSGQGDLDKLKQQKAEQIKKAQAKYAEKSAFEKKKAEIIKQYKDKAKKKAEKYAKIAAEKIKQAAAEALTTMLQEVGPIIMEIITYICLLGLGLCGAIDWIADAFISLCNLALRALTQYQRVKKAMGLAEKGETDHLIKDLTEKFLVQTVLPVGGGSILEMVPYLDYGWWAETGVLISGFLIVFDLLKSYRQAKSMENEAQSMAS
ncbi:MAG: hypothetical protein AAB558_04940 [Patescibacteria group bacterium]